MRVEFISIGAACRGPRTALLTALLLAGACPLLAQSPVGDWDIVLKGQQRGGAFLSFSNNGTFGGFEIHLPDPAKLRTPGTNPRNGGPEDGLVDPNPRTGAGATNSSGTDSTQAFQFGLFEVFGRWTNDARGRLLGYYETRSQKIEAGGTNGTSVTNFITNAVSFTGTARPGRKLTLRSFGTNTHTTLTGIPAVPQPDLAGSWIAEGTLDGVRLLEFVTIQPRPEPANNTYPVLVQGAGASYTGVALASGQGQLTLFLRPDDVGDLRTLIGSLQATRGVAKTKGFQGTTGRLNYRLQKQ
jgi:hypothetical protein